jgi:transposase
MSKFLNRFQRDELRGQHRFETEKRYADRIKALLLWDEGWTLEEVSRVLMLDEKTIRRYRKLYESEGLDRLLNDDWKGGIGRLSSEQEEGLKNYLISHLCTTTKEICNYVEREYGISYTCRGMQYVLHRLGFVYKKTTAIPGKANPEAQEKFIAMYEELMESKSDDDPVYFIDGVHAQHNSHPTNGWILRGKEHHIATNTGRQRVNINGALNAETLEVSIWEDQTINAQSTIALFATIQQKHPDAENIYVILDNAGYYRNHLVNYYVENSPIKLLFLPPYSPNLNLIERLWKFFKKKVANNRYYEKFQDFKKEALRFFKKLQLYESELDSLLIDNFQIIRPEFTS